jgi:hypothetical protein
MLDRAHYRRERWRSNRWPASAVGVEVDGEGARDVPATVDDHIEAARLRNVCTSKGANVSGLDCQSPLEKRC